MLGTALRYILYGLLWIVVIAALAATIVPRFLDRVYYEGSESDHFDGAHFFNPDGEDTRRLPAGGSRAGFFWRQLTGNDRRPAWPASVPVTPGKPAARVDGDAMVATWIGHATVLVQTQGINILTDPVWSERAGPLGLGPKRVTAPGVALADLPRIDVVLLSHNHYDHLDLATLKRLWVRDRPLIVTALGNDALLRGKGIEAQALDWGGSTAVEGRGDLPQPVTVHVTRNHHWTSRWFTDRNRALWTSFVVELPGGNLFFAGDTGFGDGQWPGEAAALGPIRLPLIPIGAFRFEAGQMTTGSHISPIDAVEVFRRLGAQTAIPIHWGTFRLSYEGYDTPPKLLAAALECSRVLRNRPGKAFSPVAIGAAVAIPPIADLPPPPEIVPLADRTRTDVTRCLDTAQVRGLR